jgi:hypothetical protein
MAPGDRSALEAGVNTSSTADPDVAMMLNAHAAYARGDIDNTFVGPHP